MGLGIRPEMRLVLEQMLPDDTGGQDCQRVDALQRRFLALVDPAHHAEARGLLFDLELIYGRWAVRAQESAFALGYRVAENPKPLFFVVEEEASGGRGRGRG